VGRVDMSKHSGRDVPADRERIIRWTPGASGTEEGFEGDNTGSIFLSMHFTEILA
jgi:hypothetical protein